MAAAVVAAAAAAAAAAVGAVAAVAVAVAVRVEVMEIVRTVVLLDGEEQHPLDRMARHLYSSLDHHL